MADGSLGRLRVVSVLGIGQVLAWGSSYYLMAVLAEPIRADTGWSLSWIVGALSVGLLVSGLVSPRVGLLVERLGGRPVLAASAVLLAAGLLGLAAARELVWFVAAWVVIGLGMGAGLYDAAFAALGRLYGEDARRAIAQVTLYGGFSSSIGWPLNAFLEAHVGWRGTCVVYAGVQLLLVLPAYLALLPREAPREVATRRAAGARAALPQDGAIFAILAAALTLASVIMTVISVHLMTLLQARGMALAVAVGLGALLGPAQVGARVLEIAFGRALHPVWSLVLSTVMVAAGTAWLWLGPVGAASVGFGIVAYGCGSGIRTIARGTVPLAFFGREGYAVLMGRLAFPTLVATAAAPSLGALLIERAGANTTMAAVTGAAVINVVLAAALVPFMRRRATAPVQATAGDRVSR